MLKSKIKIIGTLLVLSVFSLVMIGCEKETEQNKGAIAQMVDSVAVAVGKGFTETALVNAAAVDTEVQPAVQESGPGVADKMVLVSDNLYALCDAGVAVYDFTSKECTVIGSDADLNAIAEYEGSIYVGGTDLYRIENGNLIKQEEQFEGVISSLHSFEFRLMVGTQANLYSTGIFGQELLLEDVAVSAMASGGGGLWVGTDGQGLYRWDGENFQKRFLRRDTTLFDTILELDFSHNHLYAASVNGLHIYDGGDWTTYTVMDGLPAGDITAIDASGWVVYIGSDSGVVSLYDEELNRVAGLEFEPVNYVVRKGISLIASTETEGIIRQSGKSRKVLVPVEANEETEFLLSAK
ncbi:MAG: hypothetical protein P1R58_11330 [bacterium]|nr:hypothetical protein [bacterium]